MPSTASPGDDASATARPTTGGLPWTRRLFGRLIGRRSAVAPAEVPDGLLDAFPDPVLVVDADDRVRAANRAVEAVFGLAPESLVGDGLGDALFGVRDRDLYRAQFGRSATEADDLGADEHEEAPALAVVHADGSDVPVSVTIRPIASEGDARFAVTLRDVRAARADAIDARRRTLHRILDVLPDAVVALDRSGRVLFRNRASAGTRSRSDAPSTLPEAQWRAAEAVMQTGTPAVGEEPSGAGGVRLTTRIPVRGASGAVVGLVALSRDVTAEKADVARLRDATRVAEAAARANAETLATTSHEVRTLMSGVTGMTQMLLETDLDAEQTDYVETVRTSSARLLRIVNDVLDLSKMDAGMLTLEREPFEVNRVVQGALAVVMQQAGAKGVALSSEVAPSVPDTVVGDAGRIQQVLANLLTNAVKFTDDGAVRVRVEMAEGARALAFAVEDTGVGIAPDRLDAVFEQYVQADTSTARTHGGTGLGLAICRKLVEGMGGEMTAESAPGGGSVFRFTISLDEAPAPPAGEPAATPAPASAPTATEPAWIAKPRPDAPTSPSPTTPAATPAPSSMTSSTPPVVTPGRVPRPSQSTVMDTLSILPPARVLLVEDDPVMQKVTSHTLRRLGYLPTVVDNGAKGVMAVRGKPYDVVLMDIMMPVMDGLEATRQIRADPGRFPEPAIVMLTANAMKGDRDRGWEAGCDAYLTKPVAPRELAATIEQSIRARAEAGAAEEADEAAPPTSA